MTEFIEQLKSPYWVLSVFVVGIIVNLSSNLIQRWLDRISSKISTSWRKRVEANEAKHNQLIEELASSSTNRYAYLYTSISSITWGVLLTLGILGIANLLILVDLPTEAKTLLTSGIGLILIVDVTLFFSGLRRLERYFIAQIVAERAKEAKQLREELDRPHYAE